MKKINLIFVLKLIHLKVTFLGTGTSQGIPVIGSDHPVCLSTNSKDKRLRVSILVEWDNYSYVVDCGPDFRYQMLRAKCKKVDGILFTHEHADHVAGLDDIRPFCFKQGPLPIYAHQRVINNFHERFGYIFETENRYPGSPSVKTYQIDDNSFLLGNLKVIPINVYQKKTISLHLPCNERLTKGQHIKMQYIYCKRQDQQKFLPKHNKLVFYR